MITKEETTTATVANSLLLSLADASPIVGLTVWQLRGLIAKGELPVVRVGKKLYLRRATINRWVERAEGKHRAQTYQRRSGRAA
jgi:excisionase family DNA binding protein